MTKSKLFTTVVVFLLTSNFSFSQNSTNAATVEWIDIETAQERLKKEPRKVLIDVYTDWCGWCKKMDASTFAHPDIAAYIAKYYYAVKLNAESKEEINFKGVTYINPNPTERRPTHQLASLAAIDGRLSYPTIVYTDENMDLLSQVPGYFTPNTIEPILHYFAEEAYKTTPWEEYQQNFKSTIP